MSDIHRCGCGIAIGDGDYATGQRLCTPCRRSKAPRRWTRLPVTGRR